MTLRILKRQASTDCEDIPVKQPRTSAQNTHPRRLPPSRLRLLRSNSQVLNANNSTPAIERLPSIPEHNPATFGPPRDDINPERSADVELGSEEPTKIRTRVQYHAKPVQQLPEPAPVVKPRSGRRLLPKYIEPFEIQDSSDSEDDLPKKEDSSGAGRVQAANMAQSLMAIRAQRATTLKRPRPRAPSPLTNQEVLVTLTANEAHSSNNAATVPSTNHDTTKITSQIDVTPITSVARRVEELNALSAIAKVSLSSHAPSISRSARAAGIFQPLPGLCPPEPEDNYSIIRQSAIDAIAGHKSIPRYALPPIVSSRQPTTNSTTKSSLSEGAKVFKRPRRNRAPPSKKQ
ncbi:hypothetical protein CTheo_1557 [Ceratobasidium theobromae]|uniref:Uncharacterized protein n=1 Tax=Ceratobasidium theobromae TaxID=1582974 RepID=A0A5N5QTB5_9AGAM|nr:hypothetical protein CTheo_1557 [Ceratobasidium theobromae]